MSRFPLHLLQCLVCAHEGLAGAADRVYCPQCGQIYPISDDRILDFMSVSSTRASLTWAQSIAATSTFAWGYDRIWRPWALSFLSGEAFSTEREAALLDDLLGDADPILDLATASGYWSRLILNKRPITTVIGLDQASEVLVEAARQALSEWTHYSLIKARAEDLPLISGSMSAVISGASLNELPLKPCLQEVARVLKPGGVFVSMQTQPGEGLTDWIQSFLQLTGLQFFSEAKLRQELAAIGLHMDRYLSYGVISFIRATRIEATG